jgi:hypothetical protein
MRMVNIYYRQGCICAGSNAYLKINANGTIEKKIIDPKGQGGYLYSYHQLIPVNENLLLQGIDTRRFKYSDHKVEQKNSGGEYFGMIAALLDSSLILLSSFAYQ